MLFIPIGIALEPENQSLWTSLRSCEEAYSNDKKQRFAAAALEREREEELQRQRDEAFAAAKSAPPAAINEDDLLSSFFSEVKETSPAASAAKQDIKKEDDDLQDFFAAISGGGDKPPATDTSQPKPEESSKERDETQLTAKYIQQDLGDAASQLGRLIANNYKWKNLNPYVVFQLDIDATEEDIKYRYKKLSAKVHPDKLRNFENAREAFEEVILLHMIICPKRMPYTWPSKGILFSSEVFNHIDSISCCVPTFQIFAQFLHSLYL